MTSDDAGLAQTSTPGGGLDLGGGDGGVTGDHGADGDDPGAPTSTDPEGIAAGDGGLADAPTPGLTPGPA